LKLGNNGAVIWTRVFAGIINGQQGLGGTPIGPVVTYDGSSIYYTTDIYAGAGIHSIATLKYTASGDSAWIRAYNGGHFGGLNVPGDVKLDNFGNIYVCGLGNYQTTGDDIVTFKYNPAGQQLWLATYNGPLQNNGDYGHGLFIDSSLNVYVTGLSLRQNNTYNDAITIKYNQPVGITSGNMEIPTQYGLFQNYPNPFNSTTVINYQLPTQSTVKLVLFNLLGQVVETIVDQKQDAGYYSISVNLQNFSSGIYFYRLVAEGNIINTKKMIFVK
jgi:hypothetical protein